MNIYCTFLFSDTAEWELFVAKILSEKNLVKKWFVVDGAYNFKGDYIGLCANTLLQNEPRLNLYKSRIQVIESKTNYFYETKSTFKRSLTNFFRNIRNRAHLKLIQKEELFFSVEKLTRDLATLDILNQGEDDDWLLITDVDEILDTSGSRGQFIEDKLSATLGKSVRVKRLRYVFDFDNLDPQAKFCPIIKISLLKGLRPSKISDFRFRHDGLILSEKPLVFEYSYCFPLDAIRRKLQNFAHVGPNEDMFSAALRLNHHFVQPGMNTAPRVWLKQSEMEDDLHSAYIIENISQLRTGNVNPDYKLARSIEHPQLFLN